MSPLQSLPQSEHHHTKTPYRGRGRRIFLVFVLTIGAVYTVILGYHFSTPRREVVVQFDWLDRCREICLQYGLIPTGHIANDAKAYLKFTKSEDQKHSTLMDTIFVPAASQQHPLLRQPAPDFRLKDDREVIHQLSELAMNGPVVLVFYYGYHCSHCVAQLFALQEDLAKFRDAGATVVALSGDDSKMTAERFAEYGRFNFPVLSDENNRIAEVYDVYRPETNDHPEDLKHATFLIEKGGKIVWAYRGSKPFMDNSSLLYFLNHDLEAIPVPPTDNPVVSGKPVLTNVK